MCDFQYVFKIILIGDTGVGKTCLINRFCLNNFCPTHDITIGVEFGSKIIQIEDQEKNLGIKAQFWDTAGQEIFRSIVRSYYRSAAGVILCYDITQYPTYDSLPKWIEIIKTECDIGTQIMLVGTKTDLEFKRSVKKEEGQKIADEHGMLFCEVSSKNDISGVQKCFSNLMNSIYDSYKKGSIKTGIRDHYLILTDDDKKTKKTKKSCC